MSVQFACWFLFHVLPSSDVTFDTEAQRRLSDRDPPPPCNPTVRSGSGPTPQLQQSFTWRPFHIRHSTFISAPSMIYSGSLYSFSTRTCMVTCESVVHTNTASMESFAGKKRCLWCSLRGLRGNSDRTCSSVASWQASGLKRWSKDENAAPLMTQCEESHRGGLFSINSQKTPAARSLTALCVHKGSWVSFGFLSVLSGFGLPLWFVC